MQWWKVEYFLSVVNPYITSKMSSMNIPDPPSSLSLALSRSRSLRSLSLSLTLSLSRSLSLALSLARSLSFSCTLKKLNSGLRTFKPSRFSLNTRFNHFYLYPFYQPFVSRTSLPRRRHTFAYLLTVYWIHRSRILVTTTKPTATNHIREDENDMSRLISRTCQIGSDCRSSIAHTCSTFAF